MKKLLVLTILILILIFGGAIFLKLHEPADKVSISVSHNDNTFSPTTARIDILTSPYTENAKFIVYEDNENLLKEAIWMQKFGSRGYVIQKDENSCTFSVKVIEDAKITLKLRGPDKRDENNKIIQNWVEYTSVKVNGTSILDGNITVWHSKPYIYTINAKAGEIYKVEATWQKPTQIPQK